MRMLWLLPRLSSAEYWVRWNTAQRRRGEAPPRRPAQPVHRAQPCQDKLVTLKQGNSALKMTGQGPHRLGKRLVGAAFSGTLNWSLAGHNPNRSTGVHGRDTRAHTPRTQLHQVSSQRGHVGRNRHAHPSAHFHKAQNASELRGTVQHLGEGELHRLPKQLRSRTNTSSARPIATGSPTAHIPGS